MIRFIEIVLLLTIFAGCAAETSDSYLSVYDIRSLPVELIEQTYDVYEGVDVVAYQRFNADTLVVYQLTPNFTNSTYLLDSKFWIYREECDLKEGDIISEHIEINGNKFFISREGFNQDKCEIYIYHRYPDL